MTVSIYEQSTDCLVITCHSGRERRRRLFSQASFVKPINSVGDHLDSILFMPMQEKTNGASLSLCMYLCPSKNKAQLLSLDVNKVK